MAVPGNYIHHINYFSRQHFQLNSQPAIDVARVRRTERREREKVSLFTGGLHTVYCTLSPQSVRQKKEKATVNFYRIFICYNCLSDPTEVVYKQ